jgi:hypothetical protein
MGKLIIRNNGVETQLVNGVDFTSLSGTPNTYVIGVDPTLGTFEKLNPDGSIINYDSGVGEVFTGGTVTGETIFEGGLSATTISGDTFYGDGSNLTGIGGTFTGGTVIGETFFEGGLSATTISATTIYGNEILGDGSQLAGVVALTYTQMGFTITSPAPSTVNQNITLPYNSTVTYPTPLTIDSGFVVTVPAGTTLTIV